MKEPLTTLKITMAAAICILAVALAVADLTGKLFDGSLGWITSGVNFHQTQTPSSTNPVVEPPAFDERQLGKMGLSDAKPSNGNCTRWTPVSRAKPPFSQHYYEQDQQIYWTDLGRSQLIQNADASTFEINPPASDWPGIARDKMHVYANGAVLSGVDPRTFEELCSSTGASGCYAKDTNQVLYFCGIELPFRVVGADPATFEVVSSQVNCSQRCFDSYDAHQEYFEGMPVSGL